MVVDIIAEPGSTHGGNQKAMLRLIDVAKQAGVNTVKFQWTSDGDKLAERRRVPAGLYGSIAFPKSWLPILRERCLEIGLGFMCTVYLEEDLDVIAPFVKAFKVASYELTDHAFLRAHRRFSGYPVMLSTGMATKEEIFRAVETAEYIGAIMHCVSCYPTPVDQANLGAIYGLRKWFSPIPIGFSDHTKKLTTGGLAVAAGAEILEVHYRLDDTPESNPDYAAALGPTGLREYVDYVYQVDRMMGTNWKVERQPCEEPMLQHRVVTK
jgi:sialic acid synthase SpsE